jgi:hypothetical protein
VVDLKTLVERHEDYLRAIVQSIVQATLEAEMTEAIAPRRASGRRCRFRIAAARNPPRDLAIHLLVESVVAALVWWEEPDTW